MVVITWEDEYTVHVKSIDNQHKTMMRLINDLSDVSGQEAADRDVNVALTKISDYTKEHFAYEESFLEQYHYPFFKTHQAEHTEFLTNVDRLTKEMAALGDSGRRRLVNYMVSWLKNHIKNEDKQYVCFMLEHGVK